MDHRKPIVISYSEWSQKRPVGYEVLTVVVMNSSILWNIMPCSLLKVNRRFRGTWHLQLQGQRINKAINQHDSRALLATCFDVGFLLGYSSTLKTRGNIPPKCRLSCNGLHGIIYHKIEFLKKLLLLFLFSRICHYEGPRKLGGTGTDWDTSAFSLC
jgi:hypothetical protein